MKKCSKCEIDKELNDYPKIGNRCKLCLSEYRKEYKEKNKESIKEKNKIYYENNKERILEHSKCFYYDNKEHYIEYRRNNKESISKNHNKYVGLNKEKLQEYNEKYREENFEKLKEYKNNYYEKNKVEILEKNKLYYTDNRDKILIKQGEYYKNYREENKESIKKSNKEWKLKNKEYHNEYIKNRCINDSLFNLTHKIRSLVRLSFTNKGIKKNSKTSQILGCSFEDFKLYLENNFEHWMNWNNYGKYNGELNYGWDIDHKIPLSTATNEEEVVKLNHFSNLQPLCSYLNRVVKRNN